jgi:hypothetical protein
MPEQVIGDAGPCPRLAGFSVEGGSRLPQQLGVDELMMHLLTPST